MASIGRSASRAAIVSCSILLVLIVGAVPAIAAAPTVGSFDPTSGPPGTLVSVTGSGFTGGLGVTSVTFNGVGTTFNVADDQHLTATVPFRASTGKIAVTTSEGTGQSAGTFVVPAAPSIAGFLPASGPPGTQVAINGSHLTGVTAVKFNGASATFNLVSDAQVNATVPAPATTGKITVTTPWGTATSAASFTVSSSAPPTIGSFTPTSGPVGTSVTINGNHLTGVSAVRFNGVAAAFTIQNDQKVTATVPVGASTGKITLTTPTGTATSSSSFSVTQASPPTIGGFSPRSGPVGTSVTINGNHFTGVLVVSFNGASASFSLQDDDRISATVPAGATTGRIMVTTAAGSVTSGSNFTVTTNAPVIDDVSPSSGPPGTVVTIEGDRFTGVTGVRFNGVSAGFSFVHDDRVIATVPTGATTGRISLTTPSGTATSGRDFMVTGGGGGSHERSIWLTISRRHASGHVSVDDGYEACAENVPVVIKRHRHGDWIWVTTTSTDEHGDYRAFIGRSRGEYRAKAKRITLVNGAICEGERSGVVRRGARR